MWAATTGATNYEFILTVTDANGLSSSASVTVYPDKVNLTFTTQPPGLSGGCGWRAQGHAPRAGRGEELPLHDQRTGAIPGRPELRLRLVVGRRDSKSRDRRAVEQRERVATFAPAAGPSGLKAAYAFDESSGSTVADRSGFGNTGTLAGATWTSQGRFGSALTFNGTTAMER